MTYKESPGKLGFSHPLPFLFAMNCKVRMYTEAVHYRTSPQHFTISPAGKEERLALPRQGRCKCAETQPPIRTCENCQEHLYKIQWAHVFSRPSAAPRLQGLGEAGGGSLEEMFSSKEGDLRGRYVPKLRMMEAISICRLVIKDLHSSQRAGVGISEGKGDVWSWEPCGGGGAVVMFKWTKGMLLCIWSMGWKCFLVMCEQLHGCPVRSGVHRPGSCPLSPVVITN